MIELSVLGVAKSFDSLSASLARRMVLTGADNSSASGVVAESVRSTGFAFVPSETVLGNNARASSSEFVRVVLRGWDFLHWHHCHT